MNQLTPQNTPRGNIRFQIWLIVIGVFALGFASGALLNGAYSLQTNNASQNDDKKDSPDERFEKMKRDLSLNESQSVAVKTIIEQTRTQIHTLKNEVEPRYDEIRQNARTQIRALLDGNQQQRFDSIIAEKNARRENDKANER